MASASIIGIVNFALHQLGADRVNSLNENNKRARLANDLYPLTRDEVLAEGYWSSALRIINPAHAGMEGNVFKYYLPPDYIRLKTSTSPVTIDGEFLYTQADDLKIQYVSNTVEVGRYSATLKRAIGYKLAMDMAFSITQSESLLVTLADLYNKAMDKGLGYSSVDQGEAVVEISSDINNARGAGSDDSAYWFET